MSKRSLSIIGTISGVTALLMLFVIPFVCIFLLRWMGLPDNYFDNKLFVSIYFIIFFALTITGNVTMDKANSENTIEENRDEKLNEILKSK